MKLKTLFLIAALSMCLTACGKEEAVIKAENEIAAMGEITLDSEPVIKAAEDYYNTLTDKQKDKVENAAALIRAREKLSALQEEEAKRIEALVKEGVKLLRTNDVNNYEKALSCFEEADKAGNLDASFMAGYTLDWVLKEGEGQDFEKARAYYEKCTDNPYAQMCIAFLYGNGQGVTVDREKGEEDIQEAYDKLVPDKLSEVESKVYNAEGFMLNGCLFDNGLIKGENMDYVKAKEWFEKSAALGNAHAMYKMGDIYYHAKGVEQDYTKAMEWYRKAADLGHAAAMNGIGYMYRNALGVEQDYAEALEWFEKSANLGNAKAMYNIGLMYYNGVGVEQNYAKALEWWEKSADLGNITAMWNLAELYNLGIGVQNDGKVKEWLQKAAEAGDEKAKKILKNWRR